MLITVKRYFYLIFFSLFFLTIYSCKQDRIEIPWEEIRLPEQYKLTDIHFKNAQEGYITGGSDWEVGIILRTEDGGENWVEDTLQAFIISAIDEDLNTQLHTVGFVGYYGILNNNSWFNQTIETYSPFDDLSSFDGNSTLLVSGEAFSSGTIVKVNNNTNEILTHTFEHDFETIDHANENIVTACGYGQIIHSTDNGINWEIKADYTGDFFKDIQYINSTTGYICGFSGSILKTENSGETWNFLRDGDKLLVKNKPFNSLHFYSEDEGFIVGNNGLCWKTEDGGENWQSIKNLPDYDFSGVFSFSDQAFLIAENGSLIRLSY